MGYAYSLGMIAELQKAGIKVGDYYIIAPENPSCGAVDVNSFDEVWQYGSDERYPFVEQDHVAPQQGVKNIKSLGEKKSGRVYIPDIILNDFWELGTVPMHFFYCHTIKNYSWIFNVLKSKELGYVDKR